MILVLFLQLKTIYLKWFCCQKSDNFRSSGPWTGTLDCLRPKRLSLDRGRGRWIATYLNGQLCERPPGGLPTIWMVTHLNGHFCQRRRKVLLTVWMVTCSTVSLFARKLSPHLSKKALLLQGFGTCGITMCGNLINPVEFWCLLSQMAKWSPKLSKPIRFIVFPETESAMCRNICFPRGNHVFGKREKQLWNSYNPCRLWWLLEAILLGSENPYITCCLYWLFEVFASCFSTICGCRAKL